MVFFFWSFNCFVLFKLFCWCQWSYWELLSDIIENQACLAFSELCWAAHFLLHTDQNQVKIYLIGLGVLLPKARGWTRWSWLVLFNSAYSMILDTLYRDLLVSFQILEYHKGILYQLGFFFSSFRDATACFEALNMKIKLENILIFCLYYVFYCSQTCYIW